MTDHQGLSDPYGVVIGQVLGARLDPTDNEGRWPHFHIVVDTPEGVYDCAINLKSRNKQQIDYFDRRQVDPDRAEIKRILERAEGFHKLARQSGSGALDVVRHPVLKDLGTSDPGNWERENGNDLIQLMEYYLLNVARVYVFGAKFERTRGRRRLGLHDIHMNQGDPPGIPQERENGPFQDGGMLFEYGRRGNGRRRVSLLLTRFATQSLNTDAHGSRLDAAPAQLAEPVEAAQPPVSVGVLG